MYMLEYINGYIQVLYSCKYKYNAVAYRIVLVSNYWVGTLSFVRLKKVACMRSDSHFGVHNKSLCGLDW